MVRAWVKLIWNSLGVAAIAGAAQLAIAQALGIIRWDATYPADDPAGWSALLTWIAFIYAVAVLGGAAIGRRALRRPTKPDTVPARIAAALSAGVGASIAVGLAWLPAKAARPPVSVHAELLVALTAGAAIVAGIFLALLALSLPPIAGGIRAAVTWIWLAGIGSAIAGYLTYRPYSPPRLGVIDAPSVVPVAWWSGPYLMIATAAVLGIAVAAVARWAGARRIGVALCGLAGPAVAASAYLIAGPGVGPEQREPYRAALIALGVGLIASMLVAIPAPRHRKPTSGADGTGAGGRQPGYEPGQHSARGEAARPAAVGRAEPRQPLLDETYEPATYPQEPAQVYGPDDRTTYADGHYDQVEYDDPSPYEASQYAANQYEASRHEPPRHEPPGYEAPQYKPPEHEAPWYQQPPQSEEPQPPAPQTPPEPPPSPAVVEEPSQRPVTTMGQPPARTYEQDYSEWLRDLGQVPDQRGSSDREDQHH